MKIKVLHLIKSLGRGGAETLLPETLHAHNKELFEFHYIYFLPWKNQLVERLEEEGGWVVNFSANNNIQLLLQLNRVINYVKKHQIDLVHCHLPWAGFLGRLLHIRTAIPVIYTEHNKQERYHWVTKWLNKWTFNFQSKVIAVSNDVESSIRKNIHPSVPVQVVLNGVDTLKYDRKQWGDEHKTKMQPFIIGTVAVFRSQKRLTLWVEVFKKISDQYPDVRGIIVGDGPLRSQIEEKINELHLYDKIELVGLQKDVRPWLAKMDVFMMSSIFEGLPIALLEAMSMGCVPVATNAGGVGEVIVHGESGYVVPVDVWEKLVDRISDCIQDSDKMAHLKFSAKKRIQELYSMGKMVQTLEGIYQETMNDLPS